MTARDIDMAVSAFVDDVPTDLPDTVRDAIVAGIRVIEQRQPTRASLRTRLMTPIRIATAAGLTAIAFVALAILFPPQPLGVAGQTSAPAASPAAPAIPGATQRAAVDTSTWRTAFTSARYGYSIRYPDGSTIEPALVSWAIPESGDGIAQSDRVEAPDLTIFVTSARLTGGLTPQFVVDELSRPVTPGGVKPPYGVRCPSARSAWTSIEVDGREGWLIPSLEFCPRQINAILFIGDRMYDFAAVDGDLSDPSLFEAFLSTVRLDPSAAVDPAPAPSPSRIATP